MATTIMTRAWVGAGTTGRANTAYKVDYGGNFFKVPSNITSSTTVNIVIQGNVGNGNNSGYLTSNGAGKTNYYFCDVNGNNAVFIQQFDRPYGGALKTNNNPVTVNLTGLAGQNLYVKYSLADGSWVLNIYADCAISITYDVITNCNPPSSVSLSRTRNKITISWSGASGGTNNSINKYSVYLSETSGGGVAQVGTTNLHTYVTSTAASGSYTFTVSASKTYYGAVCTMGSAGNGYYSDYKWSGGLAVPAKPSVSAGTVITDTQMDNLRNWINTSGITNIGDGDSVTASAGNTYRSGLTAGSTAISASWYNAAANG